MDKLDRTASLKLSGLPKTFLEQDGNTHLLASCAVSHAIHPSVVFRRASGRPIGAMLSAQGPLNPHFSGSRPFDEGEPHTEDDTSVCCMKCCIRIMHHPTHGRPAGHAADVRRTRAEHVYCLSSLRQTWRWHRQQSHATSAWPECGQRSSRAPHVPDRTPQKQQASGALPANMSRKGTATCW